MPRKIEHTSIWRYTNNRA